MNYELYLQGYADKQLAKLYSLVKREITQRLRKKRISAVNVLHEMINEFDKQGLGPPEVLLDGLIKRMGGRYE